MLEVLSSKGQAGGGGRIIRREIVNTSAHLLLWACGTGPWRLSTEMELLHICVVPPHFIDIRNLDAYKLKKDFIQSQIEDYPCVVKHSKNVACTVQANQIFLSLFLSLVFFFFISYLLFFTTLLFFASLCKIFFPPRFFFSLLFENL